jgi:hypothetical protein
LIGASFEGDHSSLYPNHFYTYIEDDIEMDDTHVRTQV